MIKNILKQFFKKQRSLIILEKIMHRIKGDKFTISKSELNCWLERNASDIDSVMSSINSELWEMSKSESQIIHEKALQKLDNEANNYGGEGIYPVLYFLVRHLQPKVVLETGVAAGFSSLAILSALEKNGAGHLFSSDFPYFRIAEADSKIGAAVSLELKDRWSLRIEGDRVNLPLFASRIEKINLFHYDSDKSYVGREFALKTFETHLKSDSIIIFDDIQDNSHFYDLVQTKELKFRVFYFAGKWVGILGLPE